MRRRRVWSRYGVELVKNAQKVAVRHGILDSLHVLLYRKRFTPVDVRTIEEDIRGIVWLWRLPHGREMLGVAHLQRPNALVSLWRRMLLDNGLSCEAERLLRDRYYRRDETEKVLEDFPALVERVATRLASVEEQYGGATAVKEARGHFRQLIVTRRLIPSSPLLMNAATRHPRLAACFVLPLKDNIEEIMETLTNSILIQKPGEACWGCTFARPWRLRDDLADYRAPCPGTPAIKDVLMVVTGAALCAFDALFMERPLSWNYWEFHLAGFMPDEVRRTKHLPSCHLCGSRSSRGGDHGRQAT